MTTKQGHDPLQPHAHEPNPEPPTADPTFTLSAPNSGPQRIDLQLLGNLPQTEVPDCLIVSTGHGTSGPFTFGGVQLRHLLDFLVQDSWEEVEVISADGFGNRIFRYELEQPVPAGPILLATRIDGRPLTRREGLVRLIVPSEREDALRQVKWVAHIQVRNEASNDEH